MAHIGQIDIELVRGLPAGGTDAIPLRYQPVRTVVKVWSGTEHTASEVVYYAAVDYGLNAPAALAPPATGDYLSWLATSQGIGPAKAPVPGTVYQVRLRYTLPTVPSPETLALSDGQGAGRQTEPPPEPVDDGSGDVNQPPGPNGPPSPQGGLQKIIDDHLADPRNPRFTVHVRGVSGTAFVPANVRLRLIDCGEVVITGTGGHCEVYYAGGPYIKVSNAVDTLITVVDTAVADIVACLDCHVELGNVPSVLHANGTNLTGQTHNCGMGHIQIVESTFRYDDSPFSKLEAIGSHVQVDQCDILELILSDSRFQGDYSAYKAITAARSVLTVTNVKNGDTWTLSDAVLDVHTTGPIQDLICQGQSCATLMGVHPVTHLTGTAGTLIAQDIEVKGTLAWGGSGELTLFQSAVNTLTLTSPLSVISEVTVSTTLTATGGRHRWHALTVGADATLEGATVDMDKCLFKGEYIHHHGSLVHSFLDTYEKHLIGQHLVGRNLIEEADVHKSLEISGDDSYLTITESLMANLIVSGFNLATLERNHPGQNLQVFGVKHLHSRENTVGQNYQVQDGTVARLQSEVISQALQVIDQGEFYGTAMVIGTTVSFLRVESVMFFKNQAGGTMQFVEVYFASVQKCMSGDTELTNCGQVLWSGNTPNVTANTVRQLISADIPQLTAQDCQIIDKNSPSLITTDCQVVARDSGTITIAGGMAVASQCGAVSGESFAIGQETDCSGVNNYIQQEGCLLRIHACAKVLIDAPDEVELQAPLITLDGFVHTTADMVTDGIHTDAEGPHCCGP